MKERSEKQLSQALRGDSSYQQLLVACEEAEKAYLQVLERLSPEDQETVERYLALCEQMDYQKLLLALEQT